MRCSACETDLPEGAAFCPICGAKQPPAPAAPSACTRCGGPLAPGTRFCGTCGQAVAAPAGTAAKPMPPTPPPAPAASAEALARYEAELRGLVVGGVLVPEALAMLEQARRRHGVALAQHRALVEQLGCFEGMPLALAFDEGSTYLVERQSTTLILAVENLLRIGLVRSLEIQYRCSTSHALHEKRIGQLWPGKREALGLELDEAPCPGQYHLEGFVSAQFHNGTAVLGRFELPALRVAPRSEASAGPSHVSINVDAHNAALVKDIGVLGPASTTQQTGQILAGGGRWRPIPVAAACEADLDRWLAAQAGPRRGTPTPRLLGEPLPCRGVLLRIKRETTRTPAGDMREVWLLREDEVTFGRDTSRADLLLAVEPFDPPAQHPANVQASMRISSRHLALRHSATGATVADLGSANGTQLDGRPLPKGTPQPAGPRALLRVADVLSIELSPILGADGVPHALLAQRVDNQPQRSYLLASGGVGVWPDDHRLLGPRGRGGQLAPLLLTWHAGGPALQNVAAPGVTVNGERLGVGQTWALDHRDIVRFDGWALAAVEILPERYRTR
ncbi:MAG: FHA domain-containing protein [Pseudomonadota bacterium]